jgi:hypothetical protein
LRDLILKAAGLIAFGIAWLTASRIIPIITGGEERLTLSPFGKRAGEPLLDDK